MSVRGRIKDPSGQKAAKRKKRFEFLPTSTLWQIDVAGGTFLAFLGDVSLEGFGPDIVIGIRPQERPTSYFEITRFNPTELALVREFFENVFKVAEEISLGRDKKAREYADATGMSFPRLYRPVPNLVVGPGARDLDGESLLQRPVTIPDDEESDEYK